jgi:hypothetical protein
LVNVRDQVTAASQVLWDASEGQLRFGNVTLSCGSVNEDLADMWVFAQPGRAGVSFWSDGSGLGRRGVHVSQFLPSSTGIVLAHEFGHLALGMGDEYSEQNRFGACWGFGPCVEAANLSEQNHCLMQQPGGFSQTEFCTAAGHDTVLGDGLSCAARPLANGCTVNCEFFNLANNLYETTQQTAMSTVDCWTHVRNNFPFLAAPVGLPQAAEPAGFVGPTFIENCLATDTVMLILDRSGSMSWNTERDNGEVCGDGVDNDGDGSIDEADDCTQTRLAFVKAAARAWLALANNQNVRAGIVSFNDTATLDRPFQQVNDANLPGLNAGVDGLAAGGNTGIGTALLQTIFTFDAETAALNKTAFLISDGVNTDGPDPSTVVDSLRDHGVRVFTISTGGASDAGELTEIAGGTLGATVDSRSGTTLVNAFVEQWARYRNISTLIPRLPYSLNGKSQLEDKRELRRPGLWASGREDEFGFPSGERSPRNNFFDIFVETGTERLTLALAGNMSDMSGFGLQAKLSGPAGPGPVNFDTEVANPNLRLVRDGFFLLVEIKAPNPGLWHLELTAGPGAAAIQTGNLTIISDNPRMDLFTSLDRHVVTDPTIPVELTATPIFDTTLRNVNVSAVVKRPDGSVVPLPLDSDFALGGGADYTGQIADMPFIGLYEVRVHMATTAQTFNDPGESIFEPAPANAVPVPAIERTSVEYFFVEKPDRPVHDALRSAVHDPRKSEQHSASQSQLHDPALSAVHQPDKSSLHNPFNSDIHDPIRSNKHDPQQSATHAPERSKLHNPTTSITHDPVRSDVHSPSKSNQHDPAKSQQHDPSISAVHQTSRSETHNAATSDVHDPRRSALHDPTLSVQHDPATSVAHLPARSLLHDATVSAIHAPLKSQLHTTSQSQQHDSALSAVHQPDKSTLHNPIRSDIHNVVRSTLHKVEDSAQHLPERSSLHTPARSTLHLAFESVLHSPIRSDLHLPASSLQHNPAISIVHAAALSSQHEPLRSVLHSPVSSRIHEPTQSLQHLAELSTVHEPARSTAHDTALSGTHQPLRSILHDTAKSAQHNTANSSQHDAALSGVHAPTLSLQHDVDRSIIHEPVGSKIHSVAQSQTHDAALSVVHSANNSAQHNAVRSDIHDPRGSLQHDATQSNTHDPARSIVHNATSSATHLPLRSALHSVFESANHNADVSAVHEVQKSNAHDPDRSVIHNPVSSGQHLAANSQQHDPVNSVLHDPARSALHDPLTSTVHDPIGSRRHQPVESQLHDAPRSAVHVVVASQQHLPLRSHFHAPFVSVQHLETHSRVHDVVLSIAHNPQTSQKHLAESSAAHAPERSSIHEPLRSIIQTPVDIRLGPVLFTPTPRRVVEIDQYPKAFWVLNLTTFNGQISESVDVELTGTMTMHALFPEKEGNAIDTDNDGKDQIRTELVALDLTGNSRLGPVKVRLRDSRQNAQLRSFGGIEENENGKSGLLDLPPFANSGNASSFFDVFVEIQIGDQILRHAKSHRILAEKIGHKPPNNANDAHFGTEQTDLVDINGKPVSGIRSFALEWDPNESGPIATPVAEDQNIISIPEVEIDPFPEASARITLATKGSTETVDLYGQATVEVGLGRIGDADQDKREQAPTELVQLELVGSSPTLGPVELKLREAAKQPFKRSLGEIEETTDAQPKQLDLPPFAPTGTADSFFDVFFELEVGERVLHNNSPVHLKTVISHKPPAPGDTYLSEGVVDLFGEIPPIVPPGQHDPLFTAFHEVAASRLHNSLASDLHDPARSRVHSATLSGLHDPARSIIHAPSQSQAHSALESFAHDVYHSAQHNPRLSRLHDVKISLLHEPGASLEHRPVRSALHSPVLSFEHQPTVSNAHEPARSVIHEPTRSSAHNPLNSLVHDPTASQQHEPARSVQHEVVTSLLHDPARSSFHRPLRSDIHDPFRSRVHKADVSAQHDAANSVLHEPAESAVHEVVRSTLHSPLTSLQHNPEISTKHDPALSVVHDPNRSPILHTTALSAQHDVVKSVLHVPQSSQAHEPRLSAVHEPARSEVHRPLLSAAHEPLSSIIHEPVTSLRHDSVRSAIHEPSRSVVHDPGLSPQHLAVQSIVHSAFRSAHHDAATSQAHAPAVSALHEPAKSLQHEALRSQVHSVVVSAAHEPALSNVHDERRSAGHNAFLSAAHDQLSSALHTPTLSQAHEPARSIIHTSASSTAHSALRSAIHSPVESLAHTTANSAAHDPARSVVHLAAVSRQHDSVLSLVHEPSRSGAHLPADSLQHDPARSDVHDPAASIQHSPLRSAVHAPAVSKLGTDVDHNGLADDWEVIVSNGGVPPKPQDDDDADGLTNLEELLVHTDPSDPESSLKMEITRPEGNARRLRWRAVPGVRYKIQCISSLSDPNGWQDVGLVIPGNSTGEFDDNTAQGSTFYYRIIVE